ncbi:uncharacterized protein LOC133717687 isoform X1 [Rosa rugosa]|uniref:uncharacterized protein LOC133717687 isoform X1 n=1 Tax=Rosa rugosa TaxID=74645 RepID=UPI002B40B24E|nr:uncharacterized protein LOC133717687 isoform X1 [Rosa rugosa]
MRSAHPQNGGETPYQIPTHPNFQSTVSLRKLRRFNYLILIFRIAAFSSSLASFVFMLTTSRDSDPSSPRWYHFDAFSGGSECDSGDILALRNGGVGLGDFQRLNSVQRGVAGLVRLQPRPGVRVPAAVCGLGGNGAGEGFERDGHVYGVERVLHRDGHIDRVGVCRVFVPGLFVRALGLSGRLLRNQGFSFSSLEREREILPKKKKKERGNIWVSRGVGSFTVLPYSDFSEGID